MKRFAILSGLIGVLSLLHGPVHSQTNGMTGVWRQIGSNAGHCGHCRIEIRQGESSSMVAANNGWSANIRFEQIDQAETASGSGRWKETGNATYSRKFFRIELIRLEERLYLVMIGSNFKVEAVFERSPGDSI